MGKAAHMAAPGRKTRDQIGQMLTMRGVTGYDFRALRVVLRREMKVKDGWMRECLAEGQG
jgi:hypothetical protein